MHIVTRKPVAAAVIRGNAEAAGLRGSVWFYQMPAGVLVEARIFGLPKNGYGIYGFHIHEGGNCADSGSHYNPRGKRHPNHAGDLPPLISYSGRAYSAFITDRFSIPDILGRTVVIHSHPDDFTTQPSGAAGEQIACGVIQKTAHNRRF